MCEAPNTVSSMWWELNKYSFYSLFKILRDFQSQGQKHGGFQINAEVTRISNEIEPTFLEYASKDYSVCIISYMPAM